MQSIYGVFFIGKEKKGYNIMSICKYKVGDKVYLTGIRQTTFGDKWVPTEFINKPLEILSITKIPITNKELWDLELKGVGYCITSDDISKEKPF